MNNLTPELIAKAKAAKSAEELLALAKENGIELTEEDAKTCFEQLHANREISDDELEAVAGGGACQDILNFFQARNKLNNGACPNCGNNSKFSNTYANTTFDGVMTPLPSTSRPDDLNDEKKIMFL
jgi:predicted ribosomally synthesized peptide with nif11-like leader